MTLSELKAGLLSRMRTIFPESKYKYYSMAVVEDFDRPCFFTQIKPIEMDPNNYNSRNNLVTLFINYMQEEIDEADALDVIQKIRDLFGLSIPIGDRHVYVESFDYDFIGTDRNIPEITIDLRWRDQIDHKDKGDYPIMESANIIIKNQMED